MNPTNNFNIRLVLFLSLLAMVVFIVACRNNDDASQATNEESTIIDSLATAFKESGLQYSPETKREIITLQQQMSDSVNFYILTSYYAKYLYAENKIDSAIFYSKQIMRYCDEQEVITDRIQELKTIVLNDLGVYYQSIAQRDSSTTYLLEAAKTVQSLKNQEKRIDIYINLADNYMQEGDFITSADYYRKASLLADSIGMQAKYGVSVNMGLAHIYTDLNNFDLADIYFRRVEERLDSLPPNEQLYFTNTRGNYYYLANEYEKSLPWFYRTRALGLQYGQEFYQSIAEGNLGEVYLLLNRNDSAQYYLDKAMTVFGKPEASPAIAFYMKGLYASLYLQTNRRREAEKLLSEPYDTSVVNAVYIYQRDKRMEELYRQKGDYKNAYFHSKKAQEFDAETRKATVQNNIEELNYRYSQDTTLLKKDLLIRRHEQKAQQMNYTLIIILSIFTILVMISAIVLLYRRRKNEKRMVEQLNIIARLRMENIQNRISPHFIFNALNSLMPNLREHPNLNKPVDYLITVIRNSLRSSEKVSIEAKEEIKHVQNYLNLLQSLKNELPNIQWAIDETANLTTMIPAMCIQIPVENVVKYAFEEISEDDLLKINIEQDEKCLRIKITDNGKGFDKSAVGGASAKGTGSGLKILYKTIELFNTKNKEKISLHIHSNSEIKQGSQGTTVTIDVPLHYTYEI